MEGDFAIAALFVSVKCIGSKSDHAIVVDVEK